MNESSMETGRKGDLRYRIDNFTVPDESRLEFEEAMRRILSLLESQPGFLGHAVFERTGGSTVFNVTTIAVWTNREALERAGESMRAHHREIGLDLRGQLEQWGVRAEQGTFRLGLSAGLLAASGVESL